MTLMLPADEIEKAAWRIAADPTSAYVMPGCLISLFHVGQFHGEDRVRAEVEHEIEQLRDDLNYWYWRAVDPEAHAERMRALISDYEAHGERSATAARWVQLDAERQAS